MSSPSRFLWLPRSTRARQYLRRRVNPVATTSTHQAEINSATTFMRRVGDKPHPYVWVLLTLNHGLPAQEGIGHIVNDIPDVACVARAGIGNCDYVPPRACEGVDVLHLGGGLAAPSI